MVINQGDLFWIDVGEPLGAEPGYRRPFVVIQNNLFNHKTIKTVIVCALTTNLRLAAAPGNVLLNDGEANLPKQSVVVVSQVFTEDKAHLDEYIGTLSAGRIRQILNGLKLLTEPREPE